jgi:hypothetical protein
MSSRIPGVNSEIDPRHLDHPALAALKIYWDSKRAGRKMPARSDIRPADMKEHLGWIILLDALPDASDFRYRTIGTRVTQYMLADATGKTIAEAFAAKGKETIGSMRDFHRRAAEGEVPIRAYGDADWLGHAYFKFDALFLPLSDDGARANRILSAFTFTAPDTSRKLPAPPG